MSLFRKLVLALAVLGSIISAGPAGAQDGGAWEFAAGMPTFVDPFGVERPVEMDALSMADAYHGWGLSRRRDVTTIYRLTYRDGRWSAQVDGGLPGGLSVLHSVSAEEAWLMAGTGYYRRTTAGWKLYQEPSTEATITIHDIAMRRTGDAGWAVGQDQQRPNEAVMLAYRDGRWQRERSVSGPGLLTGNNVPQAAPL